MTSDASPAFYGIDLGASGGTSGNIEFTASDNDKVDVAINTSDQLAIYNGQLVVGETSSTFGSELIAADSDGYCSVVAHGAGDGTTYCCFNLVSDEATDKHWQMTHKVASNAYQLQYYDGTNNFPISVYGTKITTTDNTPTTIYTLATVTNYAYYVVVDWTAAQNDGSNTAGGTHLFNIKNVTGTVTEQRDADDGNEFDDSVGVSVSGAVSGTNYVVQVTGINPETWNWSADIRVVVTAH